MTNSNPNLPPSIDDQGGIDAYLDLPEIRKTHNGLGINDLMTRLKLGVPDTKIAKDFDVKSTNTIRDWRKRIIKKFGSIHSLIF